MTRTRPTEEYLANETEAERIQRELRRQPQPAPRNGDEIEVRTYEDDGTVNVTRYPVSQPTRSDPLVILVDGEPVPVPLFVGRHSGEWTVKRRLTPR